MSRENRLARETIRAPKAIATPIPLWEEFYDVVQVVIGDAISVSALKEFLQGKERS